ncbi:MAG TPA: amino acid ABC transporter permease [Mycobacteriales bacterium]|nr:amino acid ABC transporter permease [Mycobacteriales bacterium]
MRGSVLYDVPGPRARARNRVLSVVGLLLVAGLAWLVYSRFDAHGQWDGAKWKPFVQASTWTTFILPGLRSALTAAGIAIVLALAFGVIFAVGRLSAHRWLRWPSGVVVEFFRGIPLLILIFFASYGAPFVLHRDVPALWAVVFGLTLYNGSVLAEAFRAGILALPRGQTEAAYAVGLRKGQVMRLILVPQAARAMLPVIVSQLVVLVKDTALGYIIAYPELLAQVNVISANFSNLVQAAIVVGAVYIVVNLALGQLARLLERRFAPGRLSRATVAAQDAVIASTMGRAG